MVYCVYCVLCIVLHSCEIKYIYNSAVNCLIPLKFCIEFEFYYIVQDQGLKVKVTS